MTGSEPIIVIKNNSGQLMPVSIGNLASITSNINSPVAYQWDITSELYNNKDSVSIQVRGINQTDFQTFSFTGQPITSAAQVVEILNTFNIGVFYLVESAQTLIKVDNASLQYLQLDIYRQDNQLPVFANFNLNNTDIRMNNSSTIEIVLYATDPDGDPISFSVDNLPSFGSLSQLNYAGVNYAVITLTTTGAGDNGTYNFTANASDGFGTTPLPISLLVDGSAWPRFIRPYIHGWIINPGDSLIWTYSTINNITGAETFIFPGALPWLIGNGINFVRIFAEPEVAEVGQYLIGGFIFNGSGYANDSFIVRVDILPP